MVCSKSIEVIVGDKKKTKAFLLFDVGFFGEMGI